MGYLADRFAKKHVMLLIYSIVACAIPLLFVADVPAARYAFALLFGIGLGGDYMIIPLMAAELFGVKMLGRLMGIVLTADGIAEATAPMLVAGDPRRHGQLRQRVCRADRAGRRRRGRSGADAEAGAGLIDYR